jgi:RNA polymerase sigma factor (sigma-70 family)
MSEANADDQRLQFTLRWLEYYNFVFNFVYRELNNKSDAEDITQTTFQRFLAAMERTNWKVKYIKAYLRTTAKHLCYEFWEHRREEGIVSSDDQHDEKTQRDLERKAMESDDSMREIEDRIDHEKLLQSLPHAIFNGLSEYELTILNLDIVEELSNKEIAKVVGKDVPSVRYDLQKVRARIRYRGRQHNDRNGENLS